jgi:hypothetical protein
MANPAASGTPSRRSFQFKRRFRLFFPPKGLRAPSVRAKSFIAILIDYRANLIARLAKLPIETTVSPKKKDPLHGEKIFA